MPNYLKPIPPIHSLPYKRQFDTRISYYAARLSWEINQTPNRIKVITPRAVILIILSSLLGLIFTKNNSFAAVINGVPLFASAILGASYLVDWIFDYVKKRLWSIPVLLFSVAFSGWSIIGCISIVVIAYGFYQLFKSWHFDFKLCNNRINEDITKSARRVQTLLHKSRSPTYEYVSSVVVDEDVEHKPASAKCIVQQRDTSSDSDDDADDNSKLFLRFYLNGSLLAGAKVSQRGSNEYLKTVSTTLEVVS